MLVLSGLVAALLAATPGGVPRRVGDAAEPHAVMPAIRPAPAMRFAEVTIREQLIIRVPRRARPRRIAWRERKGDRCVQIADVAGAAINAPDSVDFILRGGRLVRAKLDASCPALDYYTGFYVLPTKDGRMCADRDAIHDRSGNECGIARFRGLVATTAP